MENHRLTNKNNFDILKPYWMDDDYYAYLLRSFFKRCS